jgi:hypothetical protein
VTFRLARSGCRDVDALMKLAISQAGRTFPLATHSFALKVGKNSFARRSNIWEALNTRRVLRFL